MKNSKIKAVTIPAGKSGEVSENDAREKRINAAADRATGLTTLPNMVAGDAFYQRNHPIPKGQELFPFEWKMRHADLFYPNAIGGALYIDMPTRPYEKKMCQRKAAALKGTGVRYVYIEPNEGASEVKARLGVTI